MTKCQCDPDSYQVKTKAETFYRSLPEGHPLHLLMTEHFKIREFVDGLEETITEILPLKSISSRRDLLTRLEFLSRHISGTRRHYLREELAIIQRLEAQDVLEPGMVLRQQHDILRMKKQRLANLIHQFYVTPFSDFKKGLEEVSRELVDEMREHIDLEDLELFPLALEKITNDQDWDEIQAEFDRLGYCCFTPNRH
jgi:hypothetical protein